MGIKIFLASLSGSLKDRNGVTADEWIEKHLEFHSINPNDDNAEVPCISRVQYGPGVVIFWYTCGFRFERGGFRYLLKALFN